MDDSRDARPSASAVEFKTKNRDQLAYPLPAGSAETERLIRQSALPGWDVRVDDVPVTPYPAAGIYFAVPVGAGVHQVTIEYRTPGFRAGLLVTLAWILAMTAAAAIRWWRARSRLRAGDGGPITAPARS